MRKSFKRLSIVVVGLLVMTISSPIVFGGEIGSYNKYLIKSLNDKNVGIRTSAAKILGERKCKQAIEPLKAMMQTDERYAARIVAALALMEMDENSVLADIKKVALNDRNETVRHVLVGIVFDLQNRYLAKI